MQCVPAEFAVDSGGMPEMSIGLQVTARVWISDGVAEGYCYPAGKLEERKAYRGLDGLLLGLEELMNRKGCPSRPEKLRSIPGTHQKRYRPVYCPDVRVGRTVSIHIYYRQHYSMQGELCLPNGQKVWFRSALELLHLLQQAISERAANA